MSSLCEYVPGIKAITSVDEVPEPIVITRRFVYRKRKCPDCGHMSCKNKTLVKTVHDFGDLDVERPVDIKIVYSQHHCCKCNTFFNANYSRIAQPRYQYSNRVVQCAIRLVVEDGLPFRPASLHLWRERLVFVPYGTIKNWVVASGEKS